jgi:hypothetical protein
LTFLDVQSLYFFQRPCAELTLATLITLCTRRPAAITGGYPKLAEHLTDVIIRKDGEIRLNEPSGQIVFHRDRAKGVMTAQGAVEAGKVLLCTAEKGKHSLFLGIKDEVVPVGMARDVLYLPDYARPLDARACRLIHAVTGPNARPGDLDCEGLRPRSLFEGLSRDDQRFPPFRKICRSLWSIVQTPFFTTRRADALQGVEKECISAS